MTKHWTIEEVRADFNKYNYVLVTDVYINMHTNLEYICPNGHTSYTTFSNWYFNKKRCKYCSNISPIKYEDVQIAFAKIGYTLLSKEYVKSSAKLDFMCEQGHIGVTTWNSFQQGHRCRCCCTKNHKLTIEEVNSHFLNKGATLLEKTYKNSKTKMSYICSNGHLQQTTYDSWKSGHGCGICAGNNKLTLDYVRGEFLKEGYILLEKEYVQSKYKLKYKCPLGHSHSISWSKWLYGRRCPTCAFINNIGPLHYNWKGGISYEPYCTIWKDKEFKGYIKSRDNYRCLNPCCDSKNPTDLVIHHINYNKKDCEHTNLITVCRSCNNKANTDREWHRGWYSAIIYRRYNMEKV